MKINKFIGAVFSLSAVAFAGCSADDLDLYEGGKDSIFIQEIQNYDQYNNPISYYDHKEHSFAGEAEDVTSAVLEFKVQLQGYTANHDRKYVLRAVPDSCTCSESDYSLEGNDFTIKAGCAVDTVRVTIFRSNNMFQKNLKVYFRIEPNENFDINVKEFKNSSGWSVDGPMYPSDAFYLLFGEAYQQPSYWSWGQSYFGNFSAQKYITLNKVMGWTKYDWSYAGGAGAVQAGRMEYAAIKLRNYLQEMADNGTPVLDDDGVSFIQLAGNYQVNYSAYESVQ